MLVRALKAELSTRALPVEEYEAASIEVPPALLPPRRGT